MGGKGKNLSSLGDLLTNIAGLSKGDPPKAEGLSPNSKIPSIFSGMRKGGVKVDNKVSKINGLVHEYGGHQWCPRALANGSRQIPPHEARGLHVQEGCPSGRQDLWQVRQLRVRQR